MSVLKIWDFTYFYHYRQLRLLNRQENVQQDSFSKENLQVYELLTGFLFLLYGF